MLLQGPAKERGAGTGGLGHRAHPEATEGADPVVVAHCPGGPHNTATPLGLTVARQGGEMTSEMAKAESGSKETFSNPQAFLPFLYRLPSSTAAQPGHC